MKTNRMKRNRRRSGFTLLEILVVIGIIAVLAAFVVPNLIGASEQAKKDMTQSQVKDAGAIANAINVFRVSVGRYPKELSELTQKPDDADEAKKWHGPYITNAADLKDAWGNEFKYVAPGKVREDSYDLWSVGPDGQDGSDDDITNFTKK
ncbi:MAG: type II secretion system major pseudopilin GspG [Phycisphaerae bacterium]|nr:type II secretion system major pseudopilin GspG [Phycisphaerae bacterium]